MQHPSALHKFSLIKSSRTGPKLKDFNFQILTELPTTPYSGQLFVELELDYFYLYWSVLKEKKNQVSNEAQKE